MHAKVYPLLSTQSLKSITENLKEKEFCITNVCGLCSQHTAQAVPAAADPASRLSALHRRGGRELQQSHEQPSLQPAPQTHAPLLQGDGVRPVRPAAYPALRRSDQLFYFKTD